MFKITERTFHKRQVTQSLHQVTVEKKEKRFRLEITKEPKGLTLRVFRFNAEKDIALSLSKIKIESIKEGLLLADELCESLLKIEEHILERT